MFITPYTYTYPFVSVTYSIAGVLAGQIWVDANYNLNYDIRNIDQPSNTSSGILTTTYCVIGKWKSTIG